MDKNFDDFLVLDVNNDDLVVRKMQSLSQTVICDGNQVAQVGADKIVGFGGSRDGELWQW